MKNSLVLVQARDRDGFWNNLAQYTSEQLSTAKTFAEMICSDVGVTRVTMGDERKVVAMYPRHKDGE